jgi:cell division protein FtsX
MNTKPNYQELCAKVVDARNTLNNIEDVNSIEFMNAAEAYKRAKRERDAFGYNMKHLTGNGKLIRV